MSYNNYYQRLRVKSVQMFDAMYFEKENHRKCHKRSWENVGCYIFGISYDTYMSYLKIDTQDIPSIPSRALALLQNMTDKLLKREGAADGRGADGRDGSPAESGIGSCRTRKKSNKR